MTRGIGHGGWAPQEARPSSRAWAVAVQIFVTVGTLGALCTAHVGGGLRIQQSLTLVAEARMRQMMQRLPHAALIYKMCCNT